MPCWIKLGSNWIGSRIRSRIGSQIKVIYQNTYKGKKCLWSMVERWMKQLSSHFLENLSDRLICAPEKVWVSSTGLESKTHCDAGAELSPGQSVRHMCSCKRNNEWKKCLRSVVERWIEAMILTISGLSQGSSHIWDLHRHRRSHGLNIIEDTWKFSGGQVRRLLR